jgi:hypothetical protein
VFFTKAHAQRLVHEEECLSPDERAAAAAERVLQASFAPGYLEPGSCTMSLEEIMQRKEAQVRGKKTIDGTCLEVYLHDDAFQLLFGMDKASFKVLAAWKRKPLKAKNGLF